MIICKKCGYEGEYTNDGCPLCHTKFDLTDAEVRKELSELAEAVKNKNFIAASVGYRILAEGGYTEAEKEYAKILEAGKLVPKNLSSAMEYYLRAAKKNDAEAAFRFSRLAQKKEPIVARFWLIYSAVSGYSEAYSFVADEFAEIGHEADAHFFYSLAAGCNHTNSAVKLARRYASGIGTKKSEAYAKWYLKRLKFPPIYALKLLFSLRKVKAEKPTVDMPKNYNGLLHSLASQASKNGYDVAYFTLCEMLANRGDTKAATKVGLAFISGQGCKQNFTKGMEHLSESVKRGNVDAHLVLAKINLDGVYTKKNVRAALDLYAKAANLGSAEAYEALGDIFYTGEDVKQNFFEALRLYDLSAKLSSPTAQAKANKIRKERDTLYIEAISIEDRDSKAAFLKFERACAMGHIDATFKLAVCYDLGLGTEKNRHGAYRWYKKASELGSKDALLPLGLCYATGRGTPLDYGRARRILTKAERLGVEDATNAIKILMQKKMKKIARQLYSKAMRLIYLKKFDEAKKHLDISSELSCPKAIYTLGCLYEFGMGTPCNKELAYELYEKAYALLFRDPRSQYKLSILRMIKAI